MSSAPAEPTASTPDPGLSVLLTRWANLNSGSDHLGGLDRMCAALAETFATLPDAKIQTLPLTGTPAQALRITCRPDAPRQVLLSGHYDTVYGADHPFQRCERLDADTLRGPGVADMKGGLVVLFVALRAFEQSPAAAQLGWDVVLTPDEEIGSPGTAPLLATIAQHHRLALVFEPARPNGDLVRARMGTGVFALSVHGRAAHAGRDLTAGRNAIIALAEVLPQIDALNRELPGVMLNVGSIRGGGPVNIVPDFAHAEVNIRIARATDEERVLARLRELLAPINAREGYRLEISGCFNRPPKEVTATEEKLFAAWQTCAREQGVALGWQDVGGGSDGNLFAAAGLACLDGLGPVGDGLHSPRESIRLSSLDERAAIAARFLARLATGEIPLPARQQ